MRLWLATLTSNREATTDDRESSSFYNLRQLNRDISSHVVIFCVFWFSCIKVEAGASSKFPVIVLSWDACATRGSIWEKYCDTLGRSYSQKAAFLCPNWKIRVLNQILRMLHTRYLLCKSVQIDKPILGLCSEMC